MIKPTQKAINDASALHNLYETDREAFCNEIKNPDKKPGLHHLLNIHPDFRPRGTADATFTGYEEGTGVWVLEHASNDHYKALEELSEADSSLSWNQKLEKIGATYYAHCSYSFSFDIIVAVQICCGLCASSSLEEGMLIKRL
ncbi:MAG: hypothetical protein M1836_003759 [Candelina mexicana]|nr:MAG: hypothetical protein M1836_003759 [Candelina mexicana]